jgi:hypothetical protein
MSRSSATFSAYSAPIIPLANLSTSRANNTKVIKEPCEEMRIRSFSCLHEKEAPDPFVGMINLKARSDRDLGDVHARRSVGRIIRMKARKRGGRSLHELGIRVWWALFLPFLSHFQTSHLPGPRVSAGMISASIRLGEDGTLPRSRALYTVTVHGVVDACASTPHAPHGVEAPPQRLSRPLKFVPTACSDLPLPMG